ncbi:MAG: GTPase HflX, partial [Candidatus Sumerlaeia bacterium]|nr:GTPase HflX [Candidatus Sumerlaeia bacterium]
ASLQVQLARLQYSLLRLKRAWTHLERQRGGGGFIGGAGEAQIEVDRRLVRDQIAKLRSDLKTVRRQRETQRKGRGRRPVPTAAIVGYTNSGKSSLLNYLTKAGVLAEDKLFATLDPTTRRIELPNNQVLLLTDTVGFIRKLPHMLVDAFMATLEEAQVSDFLVHVVDASHPNAAEHVTVTLNVLKELKADERPMLFVLNKLDLVEDEMALASLKKIAQPHVIISAKTGEGVEALVRELADFAGKGMIRIQLRIPHERSDLMSFLHREGQVLSEKYGDDDVFIEARLAIKFHNRVAEFILPGTAELEGMPR